MSECECSDEFGPCEQHGAVLVVRQGASLHTADELALLLVSDLIDCGVSMTDESRAAYDRLSATLSADTDPASGCGWFSDPDNADAARELAESMEGSAQGLLVIHDDGYNIVRPSADCPLYST